MTRREFIESKGATCRNWYWSWSFINKERRIIIFGAWDTLVSGNKSLILDDNWAYQRRRKQPGFTQAREHIRLVEQEGFQLMTFPMVYSDARKEGGAGPAVIGDFTPKLTKRNLIHIGKRWYASDGRVGPRLPEELLPTEELIEGASMSVVVNAYERNANARKLCLQHHGYSCAVCSFNFEDAYGPIGRHYIHVHHIVQLSKVRRKYTVDPINDLVPVCPNCHAMIHATQPVLDIKELKQILKFPKSSRSVRTKNHIGAT